MVRGLDGRGRVETAPFSAKHDLALPVHVVVLAVGESNSEQDAQGILLGLSESHSGFERMGRSLGPAQTTR